VIHHVSLGTNDVRRAMAFYDAVLPVVGLRRMSAGERSVNYGVGDTVFSLETPVDGRPATVGNGVHIAFTAADRGMVRAFHAAALVAGGTDDGAPGLRPEYNANYYGAFVRDPDGNKIEAVTHAPE
jgi:catechol 2,3-dioxygenase-like lactoylglutathione lyase family enzyme